MMAVLNKVFNVLYKLNTLFARFVVNKFRLCSISVQAQNNLFKSYGLDREASIPILNQILSEYFSTSYDESYGMFSEHLLLLSAISATNHKIENILEIGTYDAKTTLILSKLFPSSIITTFDLPTTSEDFINSYNRKNNLEFVKNRSNNLAQIKKVVFKELHSVNLVNLDEKFDLIWIDGSHSYPVVAMDIINAFRLANFGAYVLIDDVFKRIRGSKKNIYESIGAYESCEALKDASLIDHYTLFNKRLSGIYNYSGREKFISLFIKMHMSKDRVQ